MTQPQSGTSGPVESIHWRSLIAAVAAISAVGIAIGLGLPLLSIIMEKRGISPTLIGINSAMAGVAAMAAAPFTTRLAHAWGTSTTMLLAILLSAISGLGFYYIENFWLWFPLRLVFHGAITTLFILSEFWVNAAAPPARRGLVLGIYATVLSLGFALGPLLFSILGSRRRSALRGRCGDHHVGRNTDLHRASGKPDHRREAGAAFHALCFSRADSNGGGVHLRRGRGGRPLALPDLCDPRRLHRAAGGPAPDRHGHRKHGLPDSPRHAVRPHEGPQDPPDDHGRHRPRGRAVAAAHLA